MQQLSYSCFWNGYVQCVILGIMISNLFTIIMNIPDAVKISIPRYVAFLIFHSPQPFQLLYFRNCKMRLVAYSSSRMPFSKHSLTCTTGLEVVCPHHLEDLPPLLRFLEWEDPHPPWNRIWFILNSKTYSTITPLPLFPTAT